MEQTAAIFGMVNIAVPAGTPREVQTEFGHVGPKDPLSALNDTTNQPQLETICHFAHHNMDIRITA